MQAAANLHADTLYTTDFRATPFGNAMRTAAQVIASKAGVAAVQGLAERLRHARSQPGTQARLLKDLADGLAALKSARSSRSAAGTDPGPDLRRVRPPAAGEPDRGTDHGTASAHFLLGGRVQGGLYGEPPALDRLDGNGQPPFAVDFRAVYATVLERWWGVDASRALRGRYAACRSARRPDAALEAPFHAGLTRVSAGVRAYKSGS